MGVTQVQHNRGAALRPFLLSPLTFLCPIGVILSVQNAPAARSRQEEE